MLMQHLCLMVEQYRRHEDLSFSIFLLFQHTVESAGRIAFQPIHGPAAIQDEHQFTDFVFHLAHPFSVYELSIAKR